MVSTTTEVSQHCTSLVKVYYYTNLIIISSLLRFIFSVVDMFQAMYSTVKWMDGPIKRVMTEQVKSGSIGCSITVSFWIFVNLFNHFDFILVYTEITFVVASCCVNSIVAFTLHALVIKNLTFTELYVFILLCFLIMTNLFRNTRYYTKFIVIIWTSTILYPFLTLIETNASNQVPINSSFFVKRLITIKRRLDIAPSRVQSLA